MTPLLKNVINSIWHAFSSLSTNNSESVYKTKLKVLTANIGTLLDLYGVEKGLDHYRSTPTLNFEHFKYYLQNEVFASKSYDLPLKEVQELEGKIEEVCWLVCRKHYLKRENSRLSHGTVYHLFRIFCFLADLISEPSSPNTFQVLLHYSEVNRIASDLLASLGLDDNNLSGFNLRTEPLDFHNFLRFIEDISVEIEPLQEVLSEIYDTLIGDIIKKGNLLKKGYLLPTLKEYWFVLQTTELSYYKSKDEKDPCGCITLNSQSRIDVCLLSGKDKMHKILIHNKERTFELAALDHRTKLQWISAIQLAISNSEGHYSYQRVQSDRRRIQREAGILKNEEEVLMRTNQKREFEFTKQKLKEEMEAREAADQKAKELENSLEEQRNREQRLLDIRYKLEKLLEEETQSKRDEEIVRNLQARVLREEWEKREELEKLQKEQIKLLEEEREKCAEFERLQIEKEQQLKEAQVKLKALEDERSFLDKELNLARKKILHSEKAKETLEAQIRIFNVHTKGLNRLRRARSFTETIKDNSTNFQK